MKEKKTLIYVLSVALALAVGGLSALLTRDDMGLYAEIVTPPLSPPSFLFPVVWTVLYVLMGIGAATVYLNRDADIYSATSGLALYGVNLIVNFTWSIIFFSLRAYLAAFVWLVILWLVIYRMILAFRRVSIVSAQLQIPYLLWVTFAGYLTLSIYILN